jgi:hypothetical protein
MNDPVKLLTVYGYGFCSDSARNFGLLCQVAGLKARACGLDGHVVAESFYDNAWHMFDVDHQCHFRAPDKHVLSIDELAKDASVITAQPTDAIGFPSAAYAQFYTTHRHTFYSLPKPKPCLRLDPILGPGDEVAFDLGPADLVHAATYRQAPLPPHAASGTLTRKVNFSAAQNELLIPVKWPYVILGGELVLTLAGDTKPEAGLSVDGQTWTPVAVTTEGAKLTADFTPWFVAQNTAHYSFTLRVRCAATPPTLSVVVKDAILTTRFQFAPRTLPQVQTTATTFEAALTSPAGPLPQGWKGIQATHVWDEMRAPAAK